MASHESWLNSVIILSLVLMQIICFRVESAYESDKITSLPGQPNVNFSQFSGYITIDEYQKRSLFYYFVEAETSPSLKPLVLWLTGGPGCSSLGAGGFYEHGPFRPSGDILIRNHFSWNKVANVLYLEFPAGVGFSFSANTSFYATVNDTITAQDNLLFLERWFGKFSEYKTRDFYITGESYAGHYVPQLAQLIILYKQEFNLKGIAIGNPLLEFNTDFGSRGEYYWSHGLISDATFTLLKTVCNTSQILRETITQSHSTACSQVNTQLSKEISQFTNQYSVNLDICVSSTQSQNKPHVHEKSKDEEEIDVCISDETTKYLNRLDVQEALHAKLVGVTNWTLCTPSNVLNYDLRNIEIPTINILGSLVQSGLRVLVYSGDQDTIIPFTGSRTLVKGLAKSLGLNTTVPYTVWLDRQQVGGWTEVYGDKLSFATIRGAGHQPPYSSPQRSLVVFTAFIEGKPLPTP